jgi:putative cell wall-binding protein
VASEVAAAGLSTSDLRLVHFVGEFGRADITTRVNTSASQVCGKASRFSAFGIGVMDTRRISGADRYQTAVQISTASFGPGVPVVYLANGQRFPDALAAAAAAAKEGGPVLLTEPGRLPASTRAELIRLRPTRVVIAGGPAAVNSTVEQAVRSAVPSAQVQRRQGADRYQTAAEISRTTFSPGVAKVYVATGLSFPDALAGAAAAGRDGAPVLLVPGTGSSAGVPTAVATELARLNPAEVVILGGTAAITTTVNNRIGTLLPAAIRTRVEGRDRYETAARLAVACSGTGRVYAATGAQFADALAGAVAAGRDGCPMILIPPNGLTLAVRNRLATLAPSDITVLGGPNAVNYQNESALASYLP